MTTLFALLGGSGPAGQSGTVFEVFKLVPSYWLVLAGKTAVGGGVGPLEAWMVTAMWTAVLAGRRLVYRRDTGRV